MKAGSHVTSDPRGLYAERASAYVRFIRAVGYPAGLRAYFAAAPWLGDGLRVLDAGCGTGVAALAVRDALVSRGCAPRALHGFDLTPAMLDRFRQALSQRGINGVELAEANVLDLSRLPAEWTGYDLIVTASMLEYLPRTELAPALAGLRKRLAPTGRLVLFITRRNWITRPLIGRWWQSNLYAAAELRKAFAEAGFPAVEFDGFPFRFRYLSSWGYIVRSRP